MIQNPSGTNQSNQSYPNYRLVRIFSISEPKESENHGFVKQKSMILSDCAVGSASQFDCWHHGIIFVAFCTHGLPPCVAGSWMQCLRRKGRNGWREDCNYTSIYQTWINNPLGCLIWGGYHLNIIHHYLGSTPLVNKLWFINPRFTTGSLPIRVQWHGFKLLTSMHWNARPKI